MLRRLAVDLTFLYSVGIVLVVAGIGVILLAIILASRGAKKEGEKVQGAGVILIGPIPIVFGTDKKSVKTVLALTLAIIILVLIVILVNWMLR
jgi:uncharacterized protein (TIGR00304 family)